MGFDVARTGVASVGFVGFPSVGKVRNRNRTIQYRDLNVVGVSSPH